MEERVHLTVVRGTDWRCFLQNWGSTKPCSEQTCVVVPPPDPDRCNICTGYKPTGDDAICFFQVWNNEKGMRNAPCIEQMCDLVTLGNSCDDDFQCTDEDGLAYCARDVTGMFDSETGQFKGNIPGHCCRIGEYWNAMGFCDGSNLGDTCNCDEPPTSRAFYTTKAHACILGENVCIKAASVGFTDEVKREFKAIFRGKN
jgi:hypothetical protein